MKKNNRYPLYVVIFSLIASLLFLALYRSTIIDTTIRPVAGTLDFHNINPNFSTYFKSDPTLKDSVTFSKNDSSISFFTPTSQIFGTLTPASPTSAGSTLTYPSIFPSVSLKYTVSPTRLLEEFIVEDESTALLLKSISQQATLVGIDHYQEEDGAIHFYKNNLLIYSLPRPVLYEEGNQDQKSYGIKYDIVSLDPSSLTITKVITDEGQAWLQDEDRVYPIVIDLVIDDADMSSNWISSASDLLSLDSETTIKQEGAGSIKLSPTSTWYDASWPYRQKLTLDSTKIGGANQVFDLGHESGDFSNYTSSTTDSGDLSISAAAALNGSGYGLSALMDDATAIYVRKNTITQTPNYRYRFYFDPNSTTMGNAEVLSIQEWEQNAGTDIVLVYLYYYTATGYQLRLYAKDDAGTNVMNDSFNISDAPHYIEVSGVQASTDVSSDGSYEWWVDGVSQGSATSVDNYNRLSDTTWRMTVGVNGVDAGTSGTFYWDDLVANSDGTLIGPVLTDFPVYLDLADMPSSFHDHVNQTDARDIRLTKADGTELPREVVSYNSLTNSGELHFKYSGTLQSTLDTDVYLYYGNAGASDYDITDPYGAQNVWDSSYAMVHHFDETSGTHLDKTANNNDSVLAQLTQQGAQIGKIYGANEFDGVDDQVTVADADSLDPLGDMTFETWVKMDILPSVKGEIASLAHKNGTAAEAFYLHVTAAADKPTLKWSDTTPTSYSSFYDTGLIADTWYHVVGVKEGSFLRFFHNGSAAGTVAVSTSGSRYASSDPLRIGNNHDNTTRLDGILDELRFSSIARSSVWLYTQFNNQNSPSTFYSEGVEESLVGQTISRTVTPTDLSSYDTLTFWVRSNRIGSFMRFQFGETLSSEQTKDITIDSADTWEQKTWDISGIAASDRDAVTEYAFYLTDSSANFDFYLDDIQANIIPSPTATPGNTTFRIN